MIDGSKIRQDFCNTYRLIIINTHKQPFIENLWRFFTGKYLGSGDESYINSLVCCHDIGWVCA